MTSVSQKDVHIEVESDQPRDAPQPKSSCGLHASRITVAVSMLIATGLVIVATVTAYFTPCDQVSTLIHIRVRIYDQGLIRLSRDETHIHVHVTVHVLRAIDDGFAQSIGCAAPLHRIGRSHQGLLTPHPRETRGNLVYFGANRKMINSL